MKKVLQIYAIVSVGLISLLLILIAFFPQQFGEVISKYYDLMVNNKSILDIYSQKLDFMQNVFAYGMLAYAANIILNSILWIIAFLTNDKFTNRIVLMALIINVLYLSIIIYTIKLLFDTILLGVKKVAKK